MTSVQSHLQKMVPIAYDQCFKSYSQAGDMKKHRRTHSGEKPFHCEQCTMSLSEDGSLKKH